ncbi:MAG: hypothetical protein AABX03_04005 [Nanoarchaeota archaeon]
MALSNITSVFGGGVEDSFKLLITILQIVGGLIGIYLIFWIVSLILSLKKNKVLKEILQNLQEINNKIDGKSTIKK